MRKLDFRMCIATLAVTTAIFLFRPAYAASEGVLYAFRGGSDGSYPNTGLTSIGQTLYGVTYQGGGPNCDGSLYGCGTVFSLTTQGVENVLYAFRGGVDGFGPTGTLLNVDGVLWGTTEYGGPSLGHPCEGTCGTIFSITRSGKEVVQAAFPKSSQRGAAPWAGLIQVGDRLYGTAFQGGRHHDGTIFSMKPGQTMRVLHSFAGPDSDGADPFGTLTYLDGSFYGTTALGGSARLGTVFFRPMGGLEKVLYSFQGGTDGAEPFANLVPINGTLYGTTAYGGAYNDGSFFSITPAGDYRLLYSFSGGSDAIHPGALIDVGGTLYGIGGGGTGTACSSGSSGCGTVFKITTTGVETVLYSFQGGADGAFPAGSLLKLGDKLYGVTAYGGNASCQEGCGTVFWLQL